MRTSCMYCGKSKNSSDKPYTSQRGVEDHERNCSRNPSNVTRDDDTLYDDSNIRYERIEIELTDSVSIWV
jgi:hypothetical protein